MLGNRVAFASYHRSGNSFLKKTLELVTGVFTGSYLGLDKAIPLQQLGLLGEGIFDSNSIWITKSHHPFESLMGRLTADKIICIARNPIDVFPS